MSFRGVSRVQDLVASGILGPNDNVNHIIYALSPDAAARAVVEDLDEESITSDKGNIDHIESFPRKACDYDKAEKVATGEEHSLASSGEIGSGEKADKSMKSESGASVEIGKHLVKYHSTEVNSDGHEQLKRQESTSRAHCVTESSTFRESSTDEKAEEEIANPDVDSCIEKIGEASC